MSDYLLHLFILICLQSVIAISLNYLAGYTGIMSFGHGAFVGIGAYASAIFLTKYGLSYELALLLAIVITGLIAWASSIPILRMKDDSLVLVTFGFAIIIYNIFLNLSSLTGGALGIKAIPLPRILGLDFSSRPAFFLLSLALLLITSLIFGKIVKFPYGTVIKAIRENELVTAHNALNTVAYKRSVFVLGSLFAAAAGALYGSYLSFIEPGSFHLMFSILCIIMIILGGLGSIVGSILGCTIIVILPELLRFTGLPDSIMAESRQILYGLILVTLMYLKPQGLLGKYKM